MTLQDTLRPSSGVDPSMPDFEDAEMQGREEIQPPEESNPLDDDNEEADEDAEEDVEEDEDEVLAIQV